MKTQLPVLRSPSPWLHSGPWAQRPSQPEQTGKPWTSLPRLSLFCLSLRVDPDVRIYAALGGPRMILSSVSELTAMLTNGWGETLPIRSFYFPSSSPFRKHFTSDLPKAIHEDGVSGGDEICLHPGINPRRGKYKGHDVIVHGIVISRLRVPVRGKEISLPPSYIIVRKTCLNRLCSHCGVYQSQSKPMPSSS